MWPCMPDWRSWGTPGGVVMDDFDGDGLLDLAVTSSGPMDQMHLFHNNGDGTFSERTAHAGLIGETGGLNIIATDFDNDGHVDLLVLRGGWWGRFGEYPDVAAAQSRRWHVRGCDR